MQNRILDLRESRDLKQWQVAEAIGITQRKYSYIERGIQEPGVEVLTALAGFYGTSVDYILGITFIKEPYPREFRKKP